MRESIRARAINFPDRLQSAPVDRRYHAHRCSQRRNKQPEFGSIAKFCANENPKVYCPTGSRGKTLAKWLTLQFVTLAGRYDDLEQALVQAGLVPNRPQPSDNVFITQYPDLLSMGPSTRCTSIYFAPGIFNDWVIKGPEVSWLYDNLYLRLNKLIAYKAGQYGWHLIRPPVDFTSHGYCTKDWVITYDKSKEIQGDTNGTLHPNLRGQSLPSWTCSILRYTAIFSISRLLPGSPLSFTETASLR